MTKSFTTYGWRCLAARGTILKRNTCMFIMLFLNIYIIPFYMYIRVKSYTCHLFLSQRREIFNRRVPGFPKTTQTYPKFFKDFRRRPKMSEDIPNNSEVLKKMIQYLALYHTYRQFPKARPSSCKVNCDISVLTKYRVIYNLGKCFNSSCYSSYFSSRRENLVRKRELA